MIKPVKIFLIVGILVFGVGFGLTASAEEGVIPSWIKNTALWYGEGQVGDTEFINALQFLINQDIIKIPITEVTAAKTTLSESERAQSFVVTFSDGDYFTEAKTFYTFSRFQHISTTTSDDTLDVSKGFEAIPAFILSSLPSIDKKILYELTNSYINAGRSATPFRVNVDIVAGDGNILTSFSYSKCTVADFSVFLQQDKDIHNFSDTDGSEIRDIFLFKCAGFRLV